MKIVKSIGLKISNMQRSKSYIQLTSQIITILLFIVMCCACSDESDLEPTQIKATSITLSQTSVTLSAGESISLTATITPENATNKTITWSSSDSSVATVSNGKVTAVAVGKATITAKASNGLSSTCNIEVIRNTPPGGSEGTGEVEW